MFIVSKPIKREVVVREYNRFFETMIKAVVDIKKEIMAIDAELHADLEDKLLVGDSRQENLWGINLFLNNKKEDWIDYTALINIRPSMDNRGIEIEDEEIKHKIAEIVHHLIVE